MRTYLSALPSDAYSIAISDSDVYITGDEDWYKAVYWKNGVMKILDTGPNGFASVNAIAINSSDVYITGNVSEHPRLVS